MPTRLLGVAGSTALARTREALVLGQVPAQTALEVAATRPRGANVGPKAGPMALEVRRPIPRGLAALATQAKAPAGDLRESRHPYMGVGLVACRTRPRGLHGATVATWTGATRTSGASRAAPTSGPWPWPAPWPRATPRPSHCISGCRGRPRRSKLLRIRA